MATKIHTRTKRKLGLSSGFGHYKFFHPGVKQNNRPKTFKTEKSAHLCAEKNGLKKEQYYLKSVKKRKRFQMVRYDGADKNSANKENNP